MTSDDDIRTFLREKAEEIRSRVDNTSKIGIVRKYYPEIKELLAAGASHRDIVDILKEKKVELTLGTFAGYLTEVRQEDPDYTPPKRRPRMPSRSASSQGTGMDVNHIPPSPGAGSLQGQQETPSSQPSLTRNPRRKL